MLSYLINSCCLQYGIRTNFTSTIRNPRTIPPLPNWKQVHFEHCFVRKTVIHVAGYPFMIQILFYRFKFKYHSYKYGSGQYHKYLHKNLSIRIWFSTSKWTLHTMLNFLSMRVQFTDHQSIWLKVLLRYTAHILVIKSLINHKSCKTWMRTVCSKLRVFCTVIVQKMPEDGQLPTISSVNKLFYFHFLNWGFVYFWLSCSVRDCHVVCCESVPITKYHVIYDACCFW